VGALTGGREWLKDFVGHLCGQRDYAAERLARWPRVTAFVPQGTYVIFPEVSKLCNDVEHLCHELREQARVAMVPGAARWFGPGAAGHLRICFATSRGILKEAFNRLDAVVMEKRD